MTNRLSALSKTLEGSAILQIAGEVRDLTLQGHDIVNLSVGDFSSEQFPIPRELEDATVDALRHGEIDLSASGRYGCAAISDSRVL